MYEQYDVAQSEVDLFANNQYFYQLTVIYLLQLLKRDKDKIVFLMVFYNNWLQKDVAAIMGVNETNVSRRVKRIRQYLSKFKKRFN